MRHTSFARSTALFASLAFTVACEGSSSSGNGTPDAGPSDAGHENGGSGGAPEPGAGGKKAGAGGGNAGTGGNSAGAGGVTGVPDASTRIDAGTPDGSDASAPETDGGVPPATDGGTPDTGAPDSGLTDAGVEGAPFVRIPRWSVRKRLHQTPGSDVVLEEVLKSFTVAEVAPTRIQSLRPDGTVVHSFDAPADTFLSDVSVHPSGQVSAVLIDADNVVSLVRLDANLVLLGTLPIRDPDVGKDVVGQDGGHSDLFVNELTTDAAHIAAKGEDVVAVVYSSFYSVIAYRNSFGNGAWDAPKRTLVEPPRPVTPFLPIGGSFDTFGAMFSWFRPHVATDENGNTYVAVWAHPTKIKAHVAAFHDGLTQLQPGFGHASDSDVLLTRLNPDGTRAWTRVIGTDNEDEPYAIAASHGQVAVVGRSRRFLGNDNTFWDGLVSVSTDAGTLVGSRTVQLDASTIFLAASALPNGTWVFGGSDGWSQNPDGLSVTSFGTKLLVELPTFDATPLRHALPAGPRHNEIRSIDLRSNRIGYAGHEDGPIMHTGDGDLSLIRATGVIGEVDSE